MKKILNEELHFTELLLILFAVAVNAGCKKNDMTSLPINSQSESAISLNGFQQVNLVANTDEYGAPHVDHHLVNAWGMSANDEGEIWVSAADAGLSFVFGKTGRRIMPAVNIPSHLPNVPGNPTGNIYNETKDFIIPGTGKPAEFIFASEDGTVSAWNSGSSAVVVASRAGRESSYKGIAIANDGSANFLYVTNFTKAKIDVLDRHFNYVTGKRFNDPNIPPGYSPFNIRNIEGMLYVTYALRTAEGDDDSTGLGFGFVNVFKPDGSLVKHFAAHGTLNAPWGIAETRPGFGDTHNAVLIGNFGDGHINVFDFNGNFKGQLMNGGTPIAIDGLWAIDNEIPGISPKQLYFTAGPDDEEDGLFGFLLKE
jgi:uncharacterized protein (TIGR03118 family)